MNRAWPRAITQIVYQCLLQLWTDKTIPDEWKWRWICLLPKDFGSVPSCDRFRPIMLVECLRKIWGRVLLAKIQGLWEARSFLRKSQHGFLHNWGTDTATLQHINLIQHTLLHHLHLSSVSNDISGAFDALPHKPRSWAGNAAASPRASPTSWLP